MTEDSHDDLLRVENLAASFTTPAGPVCAVRDVSFSIAPGKTVALVGESGSGKSVVSQTIMGLLPKNGSVTGGHLFFSPGDGRPTIDLAKLDRNSRAFRAIRGCDIAMIFQEPMSSLSPLHTIGDQISEPYRLHRGGTRAEAIDVAETMLNKVGFPRPKRALEMYPFELSGGLRQRAMVAMALMCGPKLLIADEPTTALDVTIQALILKLLKDVQQEFGMAVLMITHDLGVVANVADEMVVVYHGEVMERGPLRTVFENPGHDYLKALLAAVPHFDMTPGERLRPLREIDTSGSALLRERHGGPITVAPDQPLLDVRNIVKTYTTKRGPKAETVRAVDDVSFHVMPGECLGLVGESGCGKTTLSKIIMRALTPDSGSVWFNDGGEQLELPKVSDVRLRQLRQRLQFVFQDPYGSLNPRMSVYDLISEPLLIHDIGTKEERKQQVIELMNLVGLDPRFLARYPHSFSGGQRQRISIARALALRPTLLLCDEPVSALDVSVQAQILNLLKDLQRGLGLTYLFVSHNLAVVDYMADRIAVMCRGRLVELAPRAALFNNPVHPYTQALLSAVPYPDPDRPLDFSRLLEGRASIPETWPEPFTAHPDTTMPWLDLGGEHFVRASSPPAGYRSLAPGVINPAALASTPEQPFTA